MPSRVLSAGHAGRSKNRCMSGACIRARIDIGAAGVIHSVLEGDVSEQVVQGQGLEC